MSTYKFWVDKGEQKSREDLISGFDFYCKAEDRYEAQDLFLQAKGQGLEHLNLGDGVTVFYSCNDVVWYEIQVMRPPAIYVLNGAKLITKDYVHKHFEVDL